MSINPNRPLQKPVEKLKQINQQVDQVLNKNVAHVDAAVLSAKESAHNINDVSRTALEAVTDKIIDVDKDNTDFQDVKAAYQNLSKGEKVAFAAGGILTGGALPAISLILEETAEAGAKLAETVDKAVKKRYSHPPEEKLIDAVKKGAEKVAHKVEEKVDDLKDGRVGRDLKKDVKRTLRDTFTERTPLEKASDAVKDAVQDAGDAMGDVLDDIKDGRLGRKIGDALN